MKKTFVTLLIALSASAHGYAQTSSEAVSKAERNTIRQGNEYFEKGNYAKALEAYETALRLNTTSQVATYNKALALLNMASEDTKGSENDPRMQAMQLFEQVGAACAKTDSPLAEKSFLQPRQHGIQRRGLRQEYRALQTGVALKSWQQPHPPEPSSRTIETAATTARQR